jgi:hypothetical protein
MSERYFTEADGRGVQIRKESGLYIAGDRQPSDSVLAGEVTSGQPIWWHESFDDVLSHAAIESRATPGISSVTAVSSDVIPFRRRLGVAFADYLATYRSRNPDTLWPCIVSPEPLEPPQEYVRLPHMVAVNKTYSIQDTVMWELLSKPEAETWLKQPLPKQKPIEDRLPHILLLRRLVREQVQLDSKPYQEITQRLTAGRYLSILFVYQHIDLFIELFDEKQWQEISSVGN